MKGKLVSGSKNPLAKQIRNAVGASDNETVEIDSRPQNRDPRLPKVASPPSTLDEWATLRLKTVVELKALGLGLWDESRLMLFPFEWYDAIPTGFEVVTINGRSVTFEPGVTSNDRGFGCLAYGIIAKED